MSSYRAGVAQPPAEQHALLMKGRLVIDTQSHSVVSAQSAEPQLKKTLKARHLSMIAMGGAIGAGLLVGSSTAIATAGPAVILTYLIAGLVLFVVMRMLGELASVSPETGSFSTYAYRYIAPWAGFTVGWLYWWFWAVTAAIEATAAAVIITGWLPGLSQWMVAAALMVFFGAANLLSVRSYGEAEFWFSSIKIAAISAVMIIGLVALAGGFPVTHASFANLTVGGGFFAHGVGGVFTALLAVIFSMFGAEIATIAAGESENPREAVIKAVNSVVFRILLFFVGAVSITITVIPWTSITPGISPFVTMLESLRVPYVSTIMSIVVLTALLSCLNASIYSSSRMVYSMSLVKDAPASFSTVSTAGAPRVAVLATAVVGLAATMLNYFMPEQVFSFLINTTGAIGIFVWLIIAVSHLRSRRIHPLSAQDASKVLRVCTYPYINWVLIVFLIGLLIFMGITETHRQEVLISTSVAAVLALVGVFRHR